MPTSARLASAVGSAIGRPGSRARRSPPPPPPSRDPAACLPPLRPGRRGPGAPPLRPGRRAVDPGNADPSRDLSTDVQEALDAAPLDPARCAIRTARDTARRPDQGSTPPSPPAHRISTSPGGCWAARLPPLRRTAPGLLPAAARPSPVLFGESASLLPDPPSSCPQPSRADSPLASQSAPIGS